jgi:hypothetical protein
MTTVYALEFFNGNRPDLLFRYLNEIYLICANTLRIKRNTTKQKVTLKNTMGMSSFINELYEKKQISNELIRFIVWG